MSACTSDAVASRRVARPAKGLWLAWLARAWQAHVTRGYLAEMDARMLKDIGVSPAEAAAEARRLPWDNEPRR
jgi:uncharacterized protein YjiS (DUF1127 family)